MLLYTIQDDGYELVIYVGQNAKENWDLIKQASQNDIWMHLDNHPSPHVIISLHPKYKLSKKVLNYGASLCKEHSKLKNVWKVGVIYTEVKNVSLGKEVGSVHTKKTSKLII